MGNESVHDIAVLIRTKARAIIDATIEGDIIDALSGIEADIARMRTIL